MRAAATALGYRTEPHAALLRRGGPELVTLVLDTDLTHAPDGSMHPFWARLFTGFVARMQTHNWLSIVQFQHAHAPLLPAPTPGMVMASNASGEVSLLVRDTFGKVIMSTTEDEADEGPRLVLQHDYTAVGDACAQHFHEAGCRRVLIVERTGFSYSQQIAARCTERLLAHDIGVMHGDLTLPADVDGLLDMSASPSSLARALRNWDVVASTPRRGQIVVVTNADGLDPTDRSGCARLSFEGEATGCLAADFFVAAMEDGAKARQPMLPFAIHRPGPAG